MRISTASGGRPVAQDRRPSCAKVTLFSRYMTKLLHRLLLLVFFPKLPQSLSLLLVDVAYD